MKISKPYFQPNIHLFRPSLFGHVVIFLALWFCFLRPSGFGPTYQPENSQVHPLLRKKYMTAFFAFLQHVKEKIFRRVFVYFPKFVISDPIPKPTQYPCARPPRNHIPQRQIPNASPGLTRHSNIAVVSPLPASYDNQCDFVQFNYKQEPDCIDLDCAPSPLSICQVSYDSIYDDPIHY